jgi:hypothetical protein
MDIALYIAELLQQHDEVCVSGLGTFYKTPVHSYFRKETGEFYPPSYKLTFRNDYQADTKLADHISKVKNISQPSSLYFIEKFVGQVLNELDEKGRISLSPLGTLSRDQSGFNLDSDPNLQLSHEYYGLPPVKEYRKEEPVAVAPGRYEPIQEPAFAETAADYDTDEPKRTGAGVIIAAVVVIILLAATGIHLWKPDLVRELSGRINKESPVNPPVPAADLRTEADSLAAADSIVSALKDQGFEVDTARDTVDVTVTPQPVRPAVTYEIIAASLNRQSDAEKILKAFQSKGVDARIILAKDKKRNNILISLASLPDKAAAQKELMRIKKEIEPGAYIYDLKNN